LVSLISKTLYMKKIFTLMVAALLVSGASYAFGNEKCDKEKSCCKKETKKERKAAKAKKAKDAKTTTVKA
jgi:uncharacterized protein YxeA